MFTSQKTQLSPKAVYSDTFEPVIKQEMFHLHPKILESLYHLHHYTQDREYKIMAFEILKNIEKHCKVESGYMGLNNVNQIENGHFGLLDSKFMSETLKFAYLIFTNDYYDLNLGGHVIIRNR
eukprot:NODE_66_length_25735_cov_0.318497.p24 type:complete len:123 gc:universal NODE_66_length_25735_cov_0.318497:18766-19134(+)